MPSLIQDSQGAGYGLVRDNSTSIIALGNAAAGGALLDESSANLTDESNANLLDET